MRCQRPVLNVLRCSRALHPVLCCVADDDAKILEDVQSRFEVSITQLPETIDVSSYMTA